VRRLPVLEGGKLVGIVTVREPFIRSFYPERAHVNAPLLEEVEDMLLIAERLLENIGGTLSSGKSPDEYYKTSLRKARPSERG